MSENLKLTLSTSHAYEVGTFDGGTASWTPNSTTTSNAYNYAITPNTQANVSVNGRQEWYYPWHAAIAAPPGAITKNSYTASRSICPRGWRLPSNSGNISYYNLIINKYHITGSASTTIPTIQAIPLSFILTGVINSGEMSGSLTNGIWWSATSSSGYDVYYLSYSTTSGIYPQMSYDYKYLGVTIRCIAISS